MKRNKELENQIAQLSKSNAELESIKDSQQEMIGDYQTKFEFILDENAKLQDKVSDSQKQGCQLQQQIDQLSSHRSKSESNTFRESRQSDSQSERDMALDKMKKMYQAQHENLMAKTNEIEYLKIQI